MLRGREPEACRRCHFKGNPLGVSAMVLPAKSVTCMPCHPATFSVSDTPTFLAVLVFLFGFISLGSVWVSGGSATARGAGVWQRVFGLLRGAAGALFSTRLFSIMKALLLDGLLQRRLFRQSKARWAVHALIFHPLVFRFAWGLLGFVSSLYLPHRPWTWILLDRNHPLTAFLFDLTGVMMATGILCVLIRRVRMRRQGGLQALPGPDWTSLGLFACILFVGFVVEGMRISMSGSLPGSGYAFLGYGISRFLTGLDLTGVYGYAWYAHSILTAAFVAYLPFSRMFHMIMAPISLALSAGSGHLGPGRR